MFDRSATIFRVWGIPVRLHITLLLFLPYAAFVTASQFSAISRAIGLGREAIGAPPIAWGLILAIGLFVSILLHELAHTAVARRSGAEVRSITLMMLGGVSELKHDVRPDREALMAIVGPLASLALALVSYLVYRVVRLPPGVSVALFVFAGTNLALGIFNLLPAFPMDGGRVLRGLLVKPLGRARATRVATTVGRWIAVALGIIGLISFNVLLILIAAFVYMGASAERARFELRGVLGGMRVADLMTDRVGEAHVGETAGEVAHRLLRGHLVAAKVVNGGLDQARSLGIVTAGELIDRAAHGAAEAPVQSAMHTDLPTARPEDDAAKTLDLLSSGSASVIVVLDGQDEIIGLVRQADVQRAATLASISRVEHSPGVGPS